MTDKRIPDLGANPLEVAFQDYQRMEHELGLARAELEAKGGMVNDLLRENEFLRRNYDKAVAERDRFQALAVNLATRAVGVREAVDRLVAEAVNARAAPEPDLVLRASGAGDGGIKGAVPVSGDLEAEMAALLRSPGHVQRPITHRTTLAPNQLS